MLSTINQSLCSGQFFVRVPVVNEPVTQVTGNNLEKISSFLSTLLEQFKKIIFLPKAF